MASLSKNVAVFSWLLVVGLSFAVECPAQAQYTITTVAGTGGSAGFSGDGSAATTAQLSGPISVAVDSPGNLYIADENNNRIRKVSGGTISTVAGNGTRGYFGDGAAATGAEISIPNAVALDKNGNLYIVDSGNWVIRKVTTGGTISTVAGNQFDSSQQNGGFAGDGGPATSAQIAFTSGVAVDAAGSIYVSDTGNDRIRKVDTNGNMSTVVNGGISGGTPGSGGDGGLAVQARVNGPTGLAVDAAGNLYIADTNNNKIRKLATNGIITTVAGSPFAIAGFSGDGGPATSAQLNQPQGVAVDAAGNLYIADRTNSRIRMVSPNGTITTIAGNGRFGYAGDGGPATSAALNFPDDVAVDAAGNAYVTDYQNQVIRMLTPTAAHGATTSTTLTVTGTGTLNFTTESATVTGTATLTNIGNGAFNATVSLTAISGANVNAPFTITLSGGTLTGTLVVPAALLTGSATSGSGSATITGGTGSFSGATGSFPSLTGTGSLNTTTLAIGLSFTGPGSITTGRTPPATPTHFSMSVPASVTQGTAFTFTVSAVDAINNIVFVYPGKVHFSSSDPLAALPPDSTLSNGVGTFSAELQTPGSQTLAATDTLDSSLTGTSNAIAVSALTPTHFAVSAPASATVGIQFSFTVTALDTNNNVVVAYTGTVHFTSSDGEATLPPDSTLSNGVAAFSATLKTFGSQTITATDRVTASITGTSNSIRLSFGGALAPANATPGAGSGAVQTFTFAFYDPYGWQDLSVVNVLINNFLDGRQACYLAYVIPSGSLFLVDDAGDAGGPFAGSQNSQCAVGVASANGSAGTLTLNLNITFKPAFGGDKIVYLAARDSVQNNSGWQALGVWQVPFTPAGTISLGTLSPARGTSASATPQAFTLTLTDTKGAADIGIVNLLVNNFLDGRQACYLAYVASSNTVLLVDDAGDAGGPFAGSIVLNGGGAIQNSQCVVAGAGSSALLVGNTLTLTLNVTFKASFTGNRILYAAGRDNAGGNNTDWQAAGTWSLESGSSGGSYTLNSSSATFQYPCGTCSATVYVGSNTQTQYTATTSVSGGVANWLLVSALGNAGTTITGAIGSSYPLTVYLNQSAVPAQTGVYQGQVTISNPSNSSDFITIFVTLNRA